jgi:hypothetical protein
MKGRSEEAIKFTIETMHKVAEIMFGEEFEVIQSYIKEQPPEGVNEKIWYWGKSALKLAEADYFIGVYNQRSNFCDDKYEGCEIEEQLARNNGIPTRTINCRNFICFEDLNKK